jgi:uncharacterized protein YbjQ (UPF0145 family)
MLGLNQKQPAWPLAKRMITTAESLPGAEIEDVLGVAEGIAESSLKSVSFGGVGLSEGGGMDRLVVEARERLAQVAADMGADAVVAFRYAVVGREFEKSVLAYGTAVRIRK